MRPPLCRDDRSTALVKSAQLNGSEMKPTKTHNQQTRLATGTQLPTTEHMPNVKTTSQTPNKAEAKEPEINMLEKLTSVLIRLPAVSLPGVSRGGVGVSRGVLGCRTV